MGRASKATAGLVRVAADRREAAHTGRSEFKVSDPLDTPDVMVLTARFAEVRSVLFKDTVDATVQLGRILREGRPKIGRNYLRWTRERLHIERSTAANYVRLAELAIHSPAVLERFKDLGVAKLYKLAGLSPEARQLVLRTPNLGRLTDSEFHLLTAEHRRAGRKVSGNMRAHGMRVKLSSFQRQLKTVPRGITNQEMRAGLKRDLLSLAAHLRALAAGF